MRNWYLLIVLVCLFLSGLTLILMLSACSSDSNDDITPTISGAGNMARSDRDRSGGGGKKAEMPNKEDKPSVTPETGKRSATFTSYGVRNGGRQAWRISQKGPAFGKKIKVVFSNGHTVYVNNTSQNYRERDGFVFKPGIGPNGEGISDTGTSHGGVYLHAPYGNSSKTVTFYY